VTAISVDDSMLIEKGLGQDPVGRLQLLLRRKT
jgi:hypothetical protein